MKVNNSIVMSSAVAVLTAMSMHNTQTEYLRGSTKNSDFQRASKKTASEIGSEFPLKDKLFNEKKNDAEKIRTALRTIKGKDSNSIAALKEDVCTSKNIKDFKDFNEAYIRGSNNEDDMADYTNAVYAKEVEWLKSFCTEKEESDSLR